MNPSTLRIDLSTILYILVMTLVFFCGNAYGQEFINKDNFNEKIAKDIVAVEFWAEWNKANQFIELTDIVGESYYYSEKSKTSEIIILPKEYIPLWKDGGNKIYILTKEIEDLNEEIKLLRK